MQALKHEIKKLIPLTLFFFLSFAYILLIIKLFVKEYSIDVNVVSKALLGAIIAAKTVAILDAVLKFDRLGEKPRYLAVLYRTSVYTVIALVIFLIEGFIEDYRGTKALPAAIARFSQTERFSHILAITLLVAVVFFVHNLWREIDRYLGAGNLKRFFLSSPRQSLPDRPR
ncbi:hypothetical protein V0288_14325 [Pannus brasiliensis CCIBt3594]|uniref:Uncharacterized protein n=1 Tax=Pannus brasiliensis CCIBt3594 TaxID=1427578 RepID=A0AAW9QKI1_9CHRO